MSSLFCQFHQAINPSSNMDSVSSAGGCPYLYSRCQDIKFLLIGTCSINMTWQLGFHFFLGSPHSLLPLISAACTLFTNHSKTISSKDILHLTWLLSIFYSALSCFSLSLISTFLTLSTILLSAIRLNTLISIAWITDSCCFFSTHVYFNDINVGTTKTLYTLSLVLLLSSFHF